MTSPTDDLRVYVEYLRDLGIYDLYRVGTAPSPDEFAALMAQFVASEPEQPLPQHPAARPLPVTRREPLPPPTERTASPAPLLTAKPAAPNLSEAPARSSFLEVPIPKPVSFDDLMPLPQERIPPAAKAEALAAIRNVIGDCTRCPLAYAGRRTIVFGDGSPNARLMFVGEGPGADEDASGVPFVGKAGQLLNNMISAMGLKREEVYIANIVKCRPPANRTPEPVEANTCSPFLLEQIDTIQPQVIVALGGTAATYLLGVKQPLGPLRGTWHSCRGAKVAVTYHPAYLLRDPSQKGEAWKDLQRVMMELGLKRHV